MNKNAYSVNVYFGGQKNPTYKGTKIKQGNNSVATPKKGTIIKK